MQHQMAAMHWAILVVKHKDLYILQVHTASKSRFAEQYVLVHKDCDLTLSFHSPSYLKQRNMPPQHSILCSQ